MSTNQKLSGHLTAYASADVTATVPAFQDETKPGWDGFIKFNDGDLLSIFNDVARTQVLWEGVIEMDFDINKKLNSVYADAGHTVLTQHAPPFKTMSGIPKGMTPDFWGRVLNEEKPATLVKGPQP